MDSSDDRIEGQHEEILYFGSSVHVSRILDYELLVYMCTPAFLDAGHFDPSIALDGFNSQELE